MYKAFSVDTIFEFGEDQHFPINDLKFSRSSAKFSAIQDFSSFFYKIPYNPTHRYLLVSTKSWGGYRI